VDHAGNISSGATAMANLIALPSISVSATDHEYGNVRVGGLSSFEITISNSGPGDLSINSIELTGSNADDFTVLTGGSQPCTGLSPVLQSGQSCSILIGFKPLSAGMKVASLTINSNDPNNHVVSINLSGTGVYVLNTSIRPAEKGRITGSGIDCPDDCSESFSDPTSVITLTAIPEAGYYFVRWEGDVISSQNPLTITTENHKNIAAVFATSRCVCSGCQYSRIQDAINDALDGDELRLVSGEYSENIVVNTSKEFLLSGGWDNTCTEQIQDPLSTRIRGLDSSVFSFDAGENVNIIASIKNLSIEKGVAENGGALYIHAGSSGIIALELNNTVIANNEAQNKGGGIYGGSDSGQIYLTIRNSLIVDNMGGAGGGIFAESNNGGIINVSSINNTITENHALSGGGIFTTSASGTTELSIKNTIVWGNQENDIYLNGASTTANVQYSDTGIIINDENNPGNLTEGAGNISKDPVFINPAIFNYRLNSDSPCKDAGTSDGAPSEDIEGNARDSMIDMGCYEYTPNSNNMIKVLALNGGEVIPSGKPYNITWTAPDTAKSFKVFYSIDNGVTWNFINIVNNERHYTWDVPVFTGNKKKCFIKVVGFGEENAVGLKLGSDSSDGPFTIEVIKLNTPNGGETLTSGSTYNITWATNSTKKPVSKVILSYTLDGGVTWKAIPAITGNPGTYSWTVPTVSTSKTKCKVKVVLKDSAGNTIGSDVSDAFFTISPQ
jgi:hypothetical protein